MAGIYIHIPFCKTHCSYCDFYSVTDNKNINKIIDTICSELDLRKVYLEEEKIETIYFGGGTPSFIETEYLEKIINKIRALFIVSEDAEITVELNPDDVTNEKARKLLKIGFNRASLGIQSFDDKILTFLKRRHTAIQAISSVRSLKDSGFSNISIDLIYGIPRMKIIDWEKTIKMGLELKIQHISAYHLTIEKGTELHRFFLKGALENVTEDESEMQYDTLCRILKKNNFKHYEISNFSKSGFESKHNKSYWEGKKYLGVGPSAHSFDEKSRQWNFSNLDEYISGVYGESKYFKSEKLTKKDKYNEYLLTHLRTDKGVDKNEMLKLFGKTYLEYFNQQSENHIQGKKMVFIDSNRIIVPENFWFVCDGILSDLCKI